MHFNPFDRRTAWTDCGGGWQTVTRSLGRGDSADNPASTKRVIRGPAKVTYLRAPDGGIEVRVK